MSLAFHSQIFFLTHRLRSHFNLAQHPNVVQDRSVYEDAEILPIIYINRAYYRLVIIKPTAICMKLPCNSASARPCDLPARLSGYLDEPYQSPADATTNARLPLNICRISIICTKRGSRISHFAPCWLSLPMTWITWRTPVTYD